MHLTQRHIKNRIQAHTKPEKKISISPYSEELITDTGLIEFRLGKRFLDFEHGETINKEFNLYPGSFILGVTNERLSLPNDLFGTIENRSSLARVGLHVASTSSQIASGWDGHITIEIANFGSTEVRLVAGMRICTMSLLFKDGKPTEFDLGISTDNPDPKLYFAPFDKEIFEFLSKHPEYIYKLSSRRFEELIAEIMKEMGFEVKLTPTTRDGGRDVFAYFNTPFGKLLSIVECKRYLPGNNIGINVVERFLWTISEKDKASCGLMITTSQFSAGALRLQKEYAWRLQLNAYEDLQKWLWSINADFSYSSDKRLWIQNNTKPTDKTG